MPKRSRFRGAFDKEHGKLDETLLKSESQHLYHISWPLWRQLSWKKSLLVICTILGLFVNPLTADDKYSLLNRNNFLQDIQMQLCNYFEIKKYFLNFFVRSWNLDNILKIFPKRMSITADPVLNLGNAKNLVR